MRTPAHPLQCFRSVQFLKTNTLQGSVTTPFGCGEMSIMCIINIVNFLLTVTVKEFENPSTFVKI